MPILTGKRLGPYEILSAIGAGGMGEVYRAKDTRLNRIVAIKVLPPHLADSHELKERFEREARTIASLNHPHICTLYDIGHQDGTDFLVMEYLEGETLAQRLVKGPLPLDQVLQFSIEIADALDKAHRKGVTHRDLKPGNIMLTKSGTKLLDFGLAKLREDAAPDVPLSQLPTKENVTAQGTIVGTLQYMAPEQVEGKVEEIDARTDIFAFGAVVYEMVTGKKAFDGKSSASVVAKILETDPPPMSSLQPMTPPALDHLVRRCLAKEPDERWQTASDLCRELKWLAEGGAQAGMPAPATAQPDRKGWQRALMLSLAAVALLALGGIAARVLRPMPAAAPEMRTEIVTPSSPSDASFALAPDGRQIVFVASGDGPSRLWLRRLDTMAAAQPLAGTERADGPFWSPDSRSVGFFADSKLERLDIGGGSPQTLANATDGGGTWGPDGTILFGSFEGPLFRIPALGGQPVAVTKLDRQTSHRAPHFLPGGRQFLFFAQGPAETTGLYLGSLDNSETKRLVAADTAGAYLPSGWLLFHRGTALVAQRLDLGRRELTGDPVTVADPVAAFSVTTNGLDLVAYRASGTNQSQLVWFDRSGKMLGTLGAPNAGNVVSLSPDGRRAAIQQQVQGNVDIWILDAARATRLTFDPSVERVPVWSPDGSRIVFSSNRKGHRDLYMKAVDGVGSEELLLESAQEKDPSGWSRDGRFLLYQSSDPQGSLDIWVLPMEGDRKPFPFLKTNFDERRGQFSPDGRWVAYYSNESGRYEVYVRPFNGPSSASGGGASGQWQVSTSGGTFARWGPDGKELYYIAPDGKLMAVPVSAIGATFQPGTPVALFQTRIVGGGIPNSGVQYDVSRDGRFLINTVLEDAASPITLLQNWNPEAKK